jgi:hypothetical protein
MKKSLFLSLLLSFFVLSSYGTKRITITKTGGGTSGYYEISEEHNPDGHTLTCTNPGLSACDWVVKPTVVGASDTEYDADFLLGLAETEINLGNTSGTIIHNGEIKIIYSGIPSNYTVTIEDV